MEDNQFDIEIIQDDFGDRASDDEDAEEEEAKEEDSHPPKMKKNTMGRTYVFQIFLNELKKNMFINTEFFFFLRSPHKLKKKFNVRRSRQITTGTRENR